MVSDSNSYRKNEIAARTIERELNLNAPTPIPCSRKLGDREAVTNAAMRAFRRGTPDPQVDAAEIRLALNDAKNLLHFVELMESLSNETKFLTRGPNDDVYGWLVRRLGSEEWLKASTLARDLSWPKIAHRFVEIDKTTVVQREDKARDETPYVQPASSVPAMLVRALQKGPPQKSFQEQPLQRLKEIQKLQMGRLQKSILLLGAVLAGVSVALAEAIVNWLRKFLGSHELILRPSQAQEYHHQQLGSVSFEAAPAQLAWPAQAHEPYQIQKDVDAVTDVIHCMTSAIEKRDMASLPREAANEPAIGALLQSEKLVGGFLNAKFAQPEVQLPGTPVAAPLDATGERSVDHAHTTAPNSMESMLKALELAAAAHRNAYITRHTTKGEVSSKQLDCLVDMLHKTQQKVLSQLSCVLEFVKQRTGAAMFRTPTREAAKRFSTSLDLFRDRLQLFCGMPTRERFFDTLEPFKRDEKKFEALLKLHLLSVEVANDGGVRGGSEAGHANADVLSPDVPLDIGFESPRG